MHVVDSRIGQSVAALDTPAVLVDLDVLERNVARMSAFAAEHGIGLRPHAKSHKTLGIAERQKSAGARGFTVAKLDEADAYLTAGFDDLLIANEIVGIDKWQRLAAMQRRGSVAAGIDDLQAATGMAEVARQAGVTVPVLIEVDCGLRRAGVGLGGPTLDLAAKVARLAGVNLRGVFTHAGHAYTAQSPAEVARIGRTEGEGLVETAELLTARYAGAVRGVTEFRPGNYVFYDRMQVALGAAQADDCALTVLTRVISRPDQRRVVVDAGSKTFALDRGAHGTDALAGFGEARAPHLVLERLSEEHGMFSLGLQDQALAIGDRLRFIPNHACTVANLADVLLGIRGNQVAEVLKVLVRGGGR